MIIICNNCKTRHSLSKEEISARPHSIYKCDNCGQNIKVAICPVCESYYSISFTSIEKSQYTLKCKRCDRPFEISFPSQFLQNKQDYDYIAEPHHAAGYFREETRAIVEEQKKPAAYVKQEQTPTFETAQSVYAAARKPVTFENEKKINLGELFSVCGTAFTKTKMFVAAFGVVMTFMLLGMISFVDSLVFSGLQVQGGQFFKSLGNMLPVGVLLFMFMLTATAISRITMGEIQHNQGQGVVESLHFMLVNAFPILISNFAVLLIFNAMFVLFGAIPVVGPLLFALLFLPIYIISVLVILLVLIGTWFYPPVIAQGSRGIGNNVKDMLGFVKKHNFSLVYIIPLLFILTTIFFSIVYFIHYGSLTLVVNISQNVMSEDALKIYSAIPSNFLKISEIAHSGKGIFKSLVGGLFVSHHIGGVILGIVLSLISTMLFSVFVSITATIAAYFYSMMERDSQTDDRSALVPLAVLALVLLIIYLFKRIFF